MPEYEYECEECGKHRTTGLYCDGITSWPACECGGKMQRVYSPTAVLWQGGKPSAEGEHGA